MTPKRPRTIVIIDASTPGPFRAAGVRNAVDTITDHEREIWRLESRLERLLEPRYVEHALGVIAWFKEITAGTKMFGDDSPLADAWEEYKDQVQGQHGVFFGAYVTQFRDLAEAYVQDLTFHEVELLWLGTQAFRDAEGEERVGFDAQDVIDELCRTVDRIAVNEAIRCVRESSGTDDDVEEDEQDELASGVHDEGVSREEARSIAERHLTDLLAGFASVREVCSAEELSRPPVVYGVDVEGCWIICVNRPKVRSVLLQSSYVLLVSKHTGDVVYTGPANDEG